MKTYIFTLKYNLLHEEWGNKNYIPLKIKQSIKDESEHNAYYKMKKILNNLFDGSENLVPSDFIIEEFPF